MTTETEFSTRPPTLPRKPGGGTAYDDSSPHVAQMVFEMQGSIGELKGEVSGLKQMSNDLRELTSAVNTMKTTMSTTLKVGVPLIVVILGLFWWSFGNKIEYLLKSGTTNPQTTLSAPTKPTGNSTP